MQTESLNLSISPYVNLDDTTYRILCELVEAGTAYYIVARKYPGILASDAVLDNLHFERPTINDSWRLAWGGAK